MKNQQLSSSQQDYLFSLFEKLSQKLNRPFSQMKPFYLILKQNWYDNQDALKQLTDQQYNQMKIPARLANAIRQYIKNNNSGSNNKVNQIKQIQQMQKLSQKLSQHHNKTINSSLTPPPTSLNEFTMTQYTSQLQSHLRSQYKPSLTPLLDIFQTLYKIIHNIIADPYEQKYRTLKKSNTMVQRIIVNNSKSVGKYLMLFGFEEDQEKYILKEVKMHELIFIQDVIQEKAEKIKKQIQNSKSNFLGNVKMPEKVYNQPEMLEKQLNNNNLSSSSFQSQFNQQKLSQMKYVDALQKLIQFRHKIMSQPPSDRQLKIYHKRYQSKQLITLPQINMQQQFQNSSNQANRSYWAQIINQNRKNTGFQSKRKQQFDFLIKQQIHKQTLIKIKLPNQFIIEARFGPLQKLKNVISFVTDIVIGDVYLYQAPPVKKFDKDMEKTLFELDSVPMGSFYLGINGDWYIQNNYVNIVKK